MNCATSIVYGYGFPIDTVTPETYKRFWKKHKNRELHGNTVEDLENISWQAGIGALVSNIMTEETGIRFKYQISIGQDDCDVPWILFSEALPWNFNQKEKELTVETLENIMTRYMTELDICPDKIGFQTVEYYG